MDDYEEKLSKLIKRQRLLFVIIGILAFTSLVSLVYAFVQQGIAEENAVMAQANAIKAQKNAEEANKQHQLAQQAAEEAFRQRALAEQAAREANRRKN